MTHAALTMLGEGVLCTIEGSGDVSLNPRADRLADWSKRYEMARSSSEEAELAAIGREMFAWLDEAGWASKWADGRGDRVLDIGMQRCEEAREIALLDAPWELLARESGLLAQDALQLFTVVRRVGPPAATRWVPRHHDLQLMFMAAAPEGQCVLDFEREEAAVLAATRSDGRVHVVVEETGSLAFLRGRLSSEEGPFETVHLSCHGGIDEVQGPVLLLETAEGGVALANASALIEAFGAARPPLAVLSACRTAELGSDAAVSFCRQLVTQMANVVGWDGSVYDRDAIDFAQLFYGELGRGMAVPRAVALARRALLAAHGQLPERGRHWHLARVYLGPQGGGPLCAAGKPRRRSLGRMLERAFLDPTRKRVPVATRAEFVGRRRAIQSVLRAFRDGAGVLVHGMGALGKSSLAARVLSRIPHRPVLIFERYDALAIFDEVLTALPPAQRLTRAVGLARDGEGRSRLPGRGIGELVERPARRQPDRADRGRPRAHSRDPNAGRH